MAENADEGAVPANRAKGAFSTVGTAIQKRSQNGALESHDGFITCAPLLTVKPPFPSDLEEILKVSGQGSGTVKRAAQLRPA